MRPAALPDFRKPWGRIERDLTKGDYTVTITNNYPVKSFKGKTEFWFPLNQNPKHYCVNQLIDNVLND